MDLGILPPDDATFVKNKKISDRQKEHLETARKKKLEKKKDFENKPVVEKNDENDLAENEEEENVITEEPKSISKKKIVKPREKKENPRTKNKYQLTEEEIQERIDLDKFEKFMKHMSKYEAVKKKMQEEEEDNKKIHVKYTQEEYDELLTILDRDDKINKKEIKNPTPVAPKQVEKNVIKYTTPALINNSIPRTRYNGNRNRFGRGI
jgi:hypothetical protein